jgi:UTP-glucose-1-phosphate uridylyltransferase
MSKPSLLVLAAGMGSRYGGFKQIDPVGPAGEIIIDYSIYDAIRSGFGKVVVVTVPELEAPMREHFSKTLGDSIDIVYAFQKLDDLPEGFSLPEGRTKPWGTGHAIWAARNHINEPFGMINADDFYGPSSYQVLHDALVSAAPGDYSMVGFELAKTLSEYGSVSRGICQVDAEGNLIDVVENTNIEKTETGARTKGADGEWAPIATDSVASMNFWGFDPSLFAHLESQFADFLRTQSGNLKAEFFIPTVVDTLIKKGLHRCRVLKSTEQWFGMTYKEDRDFAGAAVRKLVDAGVYPKSLRRE